MPTQPIPKLNLVINVREVENGFVTNINSSGQAKQFIGKDLTEAVDTLSTFIASLKPNANTQLVPS